MYEVIKRLQNLNYYDIEKFIKRYGTIRNVQLAQRLLILNPVVWNVLDKELKQMGEVLAYYIPVGYYIDKVYIDS